MKKNFTFVYICRAGENEELRYSIRSVVASFPNADIIVVGEPPEWYDGDYIKVKQAFTKYRNAYNNLQTICMSSKIPENFIVMNDDFYIMDKIDDVGYFHDGLLQDKADMYFDVYQHSEYTKRLYTTVSKLQRLGYKNPLSYEVHVPFPVEKWKLARATRNEALLWRSMYGNIYGVGGTQIDDVKVYSSVKMNFKTYDYSSAELPFLSSDDTSFILLKDDVLSKRFSSKTSYEKY